jgi:prepilin-type N-terminal cleavage/methylation domain-containing protein
MNFKTALQKCITGITAGSGFTLIELLITITIIALVSAIVIPGLRNFNRGQDLEVAKSMLYDGLRLSQSKATSSIVCPNVDPTTVSLDISWAVVLKNDRFTLEYTCVDRATSTPQTHTAGEDRVYPSETGITMSFNSCIGAENNTKVEFKSRNCPVGSNTCETFEITCGNGSAYNFVNSEPFVVTLSNDQDLSTSLNISEGGAIYE